MKASDNEYPSLLVKEGTVPANPAAGDQRLYIDSADHVLKRVNSSGTVVAVGASGSSLWSPDDIPASPHASDQEFNATLSGWSTLGSLDTSEANVIPSHVRLVKSSGTGDGFHGIYRACPSTPFTMTTHLRDWDSKLPYKGCGLMLLDAGPAKIFAFGPASEYQPGVSWMKANVGGARGSYNSVGSTPRSFYRMIVTSGSDVVLQYSTNGVVWETAYASMDSSLTPAYFGLFVWPYNQTVEAVFDWIRFA